LYGQKGISYDSETGARMSADDVHTDYAQDKEKSLLASSSIRYRLINGSVKLKC